MRIELLKNIIRVELSEHRALILNACQNEMEAFSLYMIQRREELSKLSTDQLESIYFGLKNFKKVA